MKNLLIIIILNFTLNAAYALNINSSQYLDSGILYSNSTFILDVYNDTNFDSNKNEFDFTKLKKGESTARNYLSIIEKGDASIHTAAKNGQIRKILYVDKKVDKIYVPLFFIPFYVKEIKTTVYGE